MKVTNNAPPNPQTLEKAKGAGKARAAEQAVEKQAAAASNATEARSMVHISDDARLMQKATEIARSAPDVRQDKVASLRQQILEGRYHVDAGAVAERLLSDHLGTDFGKNNF